MKRDHKDPARRHTAYREDILYAVFMVSDLRIPECSGYVCHDRSLFVMTLMPVSVAIIRMTATGRQISATGRVPNDWPKNPVRI